MTYWVMSVDDMQRQAKLAGPFKRHLFVRNVVNFLLLDLALPRATLLYMLLIQKHAILIQICLDSDISPVPRPASQTRSYWRRPCPRPVVYI